MPIDLGLTTDPSGSRIWLREPPSSAIEVWFDGTQYRALMPADVYTSGGIDTPKDVVRNVFSGSRTVGASFFNIHVFDLATVGVPNDIDYHGVRLHDVRGPVTGEGLRWHNIDKTSGYDWANLDAVADALADAGKDLLYMAICTPDRYAGATPGNGKYDGGGGGFSGSNQVPTTAGKTAWGNFATALAQRYSGSAHGRISTYEVWNEVNYSSYWAGTHAQYAELLRLFRTAVRAVDATLKVGAPTIQEPEGTGDDWLAAFLSASDGAAGTGKDHMDYCFVHLYPPRYNFGVAWDQIDRTRTILDAAGKDALEIWNTEAGVLLDPERVIPETWKARMLKRSLAVCAAKGARRYYWYTYDNPNMAMSHVMKDAWQFMHDLLVGSEITNCNILPDERVCITVGGQEHTF